MEAHCARREPYEKVAENAESIEETCYRIKSSILVYKRSLLA